jgi:hypothetical protein
MVTVLTVLGAGMWFVAAYLVALMQTWQSVQIAVPVAMLGTAMLAGGLLLEEARRANRYLAALVKIATGRPASGGDPIE